MAIDFGNDDADRALRGPWTKAQLGQHSVSETPGPLSSIEIPLSPAAAKGYSLGVLAQAIGIAPDEALEVGVRLNKHQVGRWKIGPEWDMQAIVLPPGSLAAGLNVVEFAMPASAGARRPMLAIDTLHLGVLLPHAEAGLAAVGVRGGLIRGFYGKEGEGADAVTWSAGLRTRVGLLVAPSTSDYELELRGYAFGPLQPLDVQAFVNSKSVGTARVDTGPRNVFRVPAGTLTPGLNIVEFVYPKAVKPADAVKGSEDQRELAIRISQVSVAPATGPKQ